MSFISNGPTVNFPSQKKLERQKNEKWAKECVEAACNVGIYSSEFLHDYSEIRTNMDLYNGVINIEDMMKRCDPFGLAGKDFPHAPEHYPIANSKINLLVGEEMKRRFPWKVKVINPDAISQKQKDMKEAISQKIDELVQETMQNGLPEDKVQLRAKEILRYVKHEYKDLRERKATHLLKHMMAKENMKHKFNMGFLDGLNAGREIYSLDIVGGDPRVRKCNPANVRILRRGQSPDVTDADIIIEWGYYSPGNIIDDYHDYLTDKEVKEVDSLLSASDGTGEQIAVNKEPHLLSGTFEMIDDGTGTLIASGSTAGRFLPYMNRDGGILVTRVVWRSFRKIFKVKYYEERTGAVEYRFHDEFYKVKTELGEEIVGKYWVSDWWEGHRIGENIFTKMRPFPVKAYSMMNPTGTLCPYVGGDYTVDGEPSTSLMGRLKPYSYYYDFMMYKQWETITKFKGVIGYLDLAMIPEGFEIEDALYYADKMGWLPIDSFKESKKGSATGTLSGNMNTNRSPMNFAVGDYIQQNSFVLQFLKEEMADISGVSKQREGSISSNELVGNTERAVQQSSHITEMYFHFHDRIKMQVLKAMLEVAKYAYRGKKLAVQYVNDDHSSVLEEIDGDDFAEIDYGIDIDSSPDYDFIYSSLQSLAQAGLQNDKVNFSQVMDIMMDPSIASVRRKIEQAEEEKYQRDAQTAENQQKSQAELVKMQQEAEVAREEMKAEFQAMLENVKTDGKIELEKVKAIFNKDLKRTPSIDIEKETDGEFERQEMIQQHDAEQKELERRHQAEQNELDRQNDLKKEKMKPKPKTKSP